MAAEGTNTAALAKRCGVPRGELRRILSGRGEFPLKTLLAVTSALGIPPQELPWGEVVMPELSSPNAAPRLADEGPVEVDPYGLQGEQAFRLAFGLGVDFMFVAKSDQLTESGIPETVLKQWPEEIVLKLDAAYHRHHEPQFTPDGVNLTISFDSLCRCFLPWSSIVKVVFFIEPPEPAEAPTPEPEPSAPGPGLRLVKG